jgi:hypothetical protein
MLVIATAVIVPVVVVFIVVALVLGSSSVTDSPSYRDGYACGQSLVDGSGSDCSAPIFSGGDPISNCGFAALSITSMNGDNATAWRQGCVDGVNAATNSAQHPGN